MECTANLRAQIIYFFYGYYEFNWEHYSFWHSFTCCSLETQNTTITLGTLCDWWHFYAVCIWSDHSKQMPFSKCYLYIVKLLFVWCAVLCHLLFVLFHSEIVVVFFSSKIVLSFSVFAQTSYICVLLYCNEMHITFIRFRHIENYINYECCVHVWCASVCPYQMAEKKDSGA